MRSNILLFYLIIIISFYSCKKDELTNPVTTDPNDDISLNAVSLDFGNSEISKTFTISVPTDKSVKWTLKRNRLWLNFDVEEGSGTKTITVTINRMRLRETFEIDTITILASRPALLKNIDKIDDNAILGEIKKIPVTVSKSFIQLLNESVGNGAQFPSEIDTSLSLISTLKIKQGSFLNLTTSLAAFTQGTSLFLDAGIISLTAKSSSSLDKRDSIPFKKLSFAYTDPVTKMQKTAYYYMPDDPKPPLLLPWTIDFDGATQHSFKIWGNNSFITFKDSILSVTDPIMTSPSEGSTINRNSDLTISWTPTANNDDKIFAVIVAASDSSYRISASAVNDNSGTLTISSSKLKLLTGSSATLYFIRYKYKIDQIGNIKAGLLTLSQRGYGVTLN